MRLLRVALLTMGLACWSLHIPWVRGADATVPQVRFIQVEPDVKLEVLDWGGTGTPIGGAAAATST